MRLRPSSGWDDKVPPAGFDSLRGVWEVFVVLSLRFVVGARWWFLCGLS